MRRGSNPSIIYDKKGRIFAIATGSDACAEHETGSNAMQKSLASGYREFKEYVEHLKKSKTEPSLDNTPSILEMKTIDQHEEVKFFEGVKEGIPFATLCTLGNLSDYSERQLERYSSKIECTGAWDKNNFAFRVYGEKLVKKLREFYESLKDGDVFFAGHLMSAPCFKGLHPSGVITARKSMLRPEHREYLEVARANYLDKVTLEFKSRHSEINDLAWENKVNLGYIWPIWKGESKQEIFYGINPSYEFQGKIDYYGPYEYEDIIEWLQSDRSQKLNKINEITNKRKLK